MKLPSADSLSGKCLNEAFEETKQLVSNSTKEKEATWEHYLPTVGQMLTEIRL